MSPLIPPFLYSDTPPYCDIPNTDSPSGILLLSSRDVPPPTCLHRIPWDEGMEEEEGGGLMNKWLRLTVSGGLLLWSFWSQATIFIFSRSTTQAEPINPPSGPWSIISTGEWYVFLFLSLSFSLMQVFFPVSPWMNIRMTVWVFTGLTQNAN